MDLWANSKADAFDRRRTAEASYALPPGLDSAGSREVAKWLRSAADLQNPGRDLDKELGDTGVIARLTKSLDQRDRPAGQLSVCGRTQAAEGLLTVTGVSTPHPICFSLPSPIAGVGPVRSERMAANCAGPLNIKLTAVRAADDATAQKPRTTNHSSGWLWNGAQPDEVAIDGVVTHPGGWYEFSDAGI